MRAQISTEYLIIVGIAIAAIIPAGYFFFQYSAAANDNTIRSQIETIGNEILVSAESVYGLPEGSLVSLDVTYPDGIIDIHIREQKELIINYSLSSGESESVFFSKIIISGNFPELGGGGPLPHVNSRLSASPPTNPGKSTLRFESKTNYVLITIQ